MLNLKFVNKSIHHTDNREAYNLAAMHSSKVRATDRRRMIAGSQRQKHPLGIETDRENSLFIDNLRSTNTAIFQARHYY